MAYFKKKIFFQINNLTKHLKKFYKEQSQMLTEERK